MEEEAAVADVWVWGPPGQVTMNPFWAVRRMTQKQMRICTADDTGSGGLLGDRKSRRTIRFNCKLEPHVMSCVTVGVVQGNESVNTTRCADVLFLTNTVDVGGRRRGARSGGAREDARKKRANQKDVAGCVQGRREES